MEKETLNPDESFKAEGEYRPGRSSILKPQRPRTPFQEVTFRSVTEEFDLTNRRRRVSFANVNIVKEFCSKTESQHIGNIEPYEETFAQSSDSSQYSNSVLSRNSTGLFISPAKQESPNSSVYNEESMELTSNSICEPSAMTQEQTKCFPNSMEKTCTDKSFDANMSMTNVLNFPYQISMPDKDNLFKRNYLEMSDNDMEFTEAIPKVANRTLNFPKDHGTSVMEFTEVIPRRLIIAPSLEDRCQDLKIEDQNKRKPKKTLTVCDEVDKVSPCQNTGENQNAVDMSLVTTGFTDLNKWSFKPKESPDMSSVTTSSLHTNVKTSINLKESDMSLVTASSTLLNRLSVKVQDASDNAGFELKDDMSLVTASSALLSRLSVKPVQDASENSHVKSREPVDMSLVTASSTLLNRSSIKTAKDGKPKDSDDMSSVAASSMFSNRLSVKPVQGTSEHAHVKAREPDDMSSVAGCSMFSNRLSVKPVQDCTKDGNVKLKEPDDMSLVTASSTLINRLSVKPASDNNHVKPEESDDMSLVTASSVLLNRLSVKPVQDSGDMVADSSTFSNRLSIKPVQDETETAHSNPKDHDMSLVTTSSTLLNRLSPKLAQNASENTIVKPQEPDDMSLVTANSTLLNILSVKQVKNGAELNLANIPPVVRKSIKPTYNPKDEITVNSNRWCTKLAFNTQDESLDMTTNSVKHASVNNLENVAPISRKRVKPHEKAKNLIPKPAARLSVNPFDKEDSLDDSLELVDPSRALNARKSIKPCYVDDSLESSMGLDIDKSPIRSSSYPIVDVPASRKSIKPCYDDPDHDISADVSLAETSIGMDKPPTKSSSYPDDSIINANMPASRKSIKPSYDDPEHDISADISLAETSIGMDKPPISLSTYPCEKDDSIVDIQTNTPALRKSTKPNYDPEDINVSKDASVQDPPDFNHDGRPATRLSIYYPIEKGDYHDESLDLVHTEVSPSRKSIKPSNANRKSDSEPCENLPSIRNISLKNTEPNWEENIELSVKSLHNSEIRRECVLKKSLIPGVIPLSPSEKTKQSFIDCETEMMDDHKVSFKYNDDLKAVSFAQSTIPMDMNDSSVMDEDFEQEPQESTTPVSEKSQELMCILPCGKECNINKTPREALFKTPKSENSKMDKFELYNLKKKSIEFMKKLDFKWMSFLKWKLEIYDHFYLVVELSQTVKITNATHINNLYFFRGPYVKEGDILDFVENIFRANFPNLQCSIVENITKIQKVLYSFWKEVEPIVKSLRNLRLYYPYTLKDNRMTFTVDDIGKEIIFDVTIDLTEWRTGIKKEHIYIDQCFGTVSEHLVKHLFQSNDTDFIKYIIDLKKYAFI